MQSSPFLLPPLQKQTPNPMRLRSTVQGIAAGQMQIELTALGFQSHQIGGFDAEGLTAYLNSPDTLTPMAMMAIGKSSEAPKKDRQRKPLAEIVTQ